MNYSVRVRFAPSPTGKLHLGGLRTALYNYLFAKSHNGTFVLRLEDTDQTRCTPGAAESLEEILNWAGIPPDESPAKGGLYGPYIQSERLNIYRKYLNELLKNGNAYKCFCSEKRLEILQKNAIRRFEVPKYDNKCQLLSEERASELQRQGTPYCIRFKLDEITKPFHDMIYGDILHNVTEYEGDPVIIKSDGYPTYHYANVIDDHLMKITHVLRGAEWTVSTPKHLLIYRAFNWEPPVYAHLPLIKSKDGSKLSKRHDDLHVEKLKACGYSSTAVINFISEIGGGFDNNKEHNKIYALPELIEKFHISRILTNHSVVDLDKLEFFSRLDLNKRLEDNLESLAVVSNVRELIKSHYHLFPSENPRHSEMLSDQNLLNLLKWASSRISKPSDLLDSKFQFLWKVPDLHSLDSLPFLGNIYNVIATLIETLSSVDDHDCTKDKFTMLVKAVGSQYNIKTAQMMKLVRISLSGLEEGPPVGEILEIIGKTSALQRLAYVRDLHSK